MWKVFIVFRWVPIFTSFNEYSCGFSNGLFYKLKILELNCLSMIFYISLTKSSDQILNKMLLLTNSTLCICYTYILSAYHQFYSLPGARLAGKTGTHWGMVKIIEKRVYWNELLLSDWITLCIDPEIKIANIIKIFLSNCVLCCKY